MENKKAPKTTEQKRGDILKKRLNLTNEFIEDHFSDKMTFDEFLESKGVSMEQFFAGLPTSMLLKGMENMKATDKELLSWHDELATLYAELHVAHNQKMAQAAVAPDQSLEHIVEEGFHSDQASAQPMLGGLAQQDENFEANEKSLERGINNDPDEFGYDANADGSKKPKHLNFTIGHGKNKKGVIKFIEDGATSIYKEDTKILKAPVRGAFLSMLDLNLVGLATSLNLVKIDKDQTHWNKILAAWKDQFQGDDQKLINAVNIGKNKKQLFKGLVGKKHHSMDAVDDGHWAQAEGDTTNDPSVNTPAAQAASTPPVTTPTSTSQIGKEVADTAAGLAGLTGVLAAAAPAGDTVVPYTATGSGALFAIHPILDSFATKNGGAKSPPITADAIPTTPGRIGSTSATDKVKGIFTKYKTAIIVSLSLIGIIGIVALVIPKSKAA